ncbi:MAG: hypothetical protein LQ339_007930 [Xanthoria mediterranea]|nr:MAG: hypothetical protein LQ339_007930 [Xanthoria mediterranea]
MPESGLHIAIEKAADDALLLDRLPTEIQRLIYVNLLKADLVREPPDEYLLRSYRFQTAILSVSRRIHAVAHPILYQENHFVVMSGNYAGDMVESLMGNRVAIISAEPATVARFNRHVARIHIHYPFETDQNNCPKPNEVRHSFIVLHSELPGVVQLLKTMDAMMKGATAAYRIKFRIEKRGSMADLPAEKLVLEPFRQLSSAYLSVKVFGADSAYTQDLLHDMMFPIQWTRTVDWRVYDLMTFHFHFAEDAIRAGNLEWAVSQFRRCYLLWLVPARNNDRLGHSCDSNCAASMWFVYTASQTNIVLLGLKHPKLHRELGGWQWLLGMASWIDQPYAPVVRKLRSRTHHYRGLIYTLMGGNPARALAEFETAKRLHPGNPMLDKHIQITRQRLGPDSLMAGLADEITAEDIPFELVKISDQPGDAYASSELIATERAILQKLGYKGDLLLHIPAKEAIRQKNVDNAEEHLRHLSRHPAGNFDPNAPVWLSSTKLEANGSWNVSFEQ